jgi:hypothetical protein
MFTFAVGSCSRFLTVCCTAMIILVQQSPARAGGCDSGHWIQEVLADGKIVQLEDNSVWEVDTTDTVTTSIWLPTDDIIVCGEEKLINVDDKESVGARRLR